MPATSSSLPRSWVVAMSTAAVACGGCLGHAGPLALEAPTQALEEERSASPIALAASDVELVVTGPALDEEAAGVTRRYLAEQLTRRLGPPAADAVEVGTRLHLTRWQPALLVTGPYKRLSVSLETELPGAHVVRTAARTALLDGADGFALEHVGLSAALAEGALALGLAGAGVALAGNDPQRAATYVLLGAVPAASAAGLTALLGAVMRGHALAHQEERAANLLQELIRAHAADLRADAARRSGTASVALPQGPSAVTLTLKDEEQCVSRADLERDLEALVPASLGERYALEVTVAAAGRGTLTVHLVLRPLGAGALAERELSVARADCATLPRALARIVRKHVEAAAPTGAGALPRGAP